MKLDINDGYFCCLECGADILKDDQVCHNCSAKIEWVGEEYCEWKEENDHNDAYYDTSCDRALLFNVGGVEFNQFKYCPFCQKQIKVVK
jgi:hypothetical protein